MRIAILMVFLIILAACTQQNPAPDPQSRQIIVAQDDKKTDKEMPMLDEHEKEQENHEKTEFANKDTILSELARLSSLSASRKIAMSDLEVLEMLLEGNPASEHALEELEALIEHKKYEHASHSISFFDTLVRTGSHPICPAHELGHYYVFMSMEQEELAEHALEEAQEQLDKWRPEAKEQLEEFPGKYTFEEIDARINGFLKRIESGDDEATEADIDFLINDASICVEHE